MAIAYKTYEKIQLEDNPAKFPDKKKWPAPKYIQAVTEALDELEGKPLGLELLTKLNARLKKGNMRILIGFTTANACRSGPGMGVKLLEAQGSKDFAEELCLTLGLNMAGKLPDLNDDDNKEKLAMVANVLFSNPVPRWDPNKCKNNPLKLTGADDYLPLVTKWVTGAQVAPGEEGMLKFTLLAWLFNRERDRKENGTGGVRALRRGDGSSSAVMWNPDMQNPDAPRPPKIALYHELCHAYYSAYGEQLSAEGSEEKDGPLYEIMTTGLGPYFAHQTPKAASGWKFCENSFRALFGVPPRNSYK